MNYLNLWILFVSIFIARSTDTSADCIKCRQMITTLRTLLSNPDQYGELQMIGFEICMTYYMPNQVECTNWIKNFKGVASVALANKYANPDVICTYIS